MPALPSRLVWCALVIAGIATAVAVLPAAASGAQADASPATMPSFVVERIPFDVQIERADLESVPFALMIVRGDDEAVYTRHGLFPATIRNIRVPQSGDYQLVLTTAGQTWETNFRSIPGWMTLLAPLCAILIALVFRQVHVALFAGIWLGAIIIKDNNIITGFFYVVDHYVVDALAGSGGWDHTSIAIFTLLLGGLVGVIYANGGARGIVLSVSQLATNRRRGQLATWLMGVLIFFDDYTNTLIVGNTMRPLTDKLRISREKLSYIVDSTAAPVACIAVITSWIGFEISLIKDALESVGMVNENPFGMFLAAIPHSYYPILTLLFVFAIGFFERDYGPMLKAERRTLATGAVLSEKAAPIANIGADVEEHPGAPARWYNAVVPVIVVVAGTVFGLIETGRESLSATGATAISPFDALRSGNSFVALLWSSFAGCVVAILMTLVQRIMSLTQVIGAWVSGIKAMSPAIVILVLAWCIGAVCTDLHTADYLVASMSNVIAPELLPVLIFLVAAAVSFATGTSWGTMTILTPLCIPLVIQIAHLHGIVGIAEHDILLSGIAAILSGAVFGDHCSPISDTTIMSSMASNADHVDHVRTQLPYALSAAAVGMGFGYIPAALGLPNLVALAISAVAVFGVVRFFGRRVDASA